MSTASIRTPGSQDQHGTCTEVCLLSHNNSPSEKHNEALARILKMEERLLNFQKSKLTGVTYLACNIILILYHKYFFHQLKNHLFAYLRGACSFLMIWTKLHMELNQHSQKERIKYLKCTENIS